MVLFLLCRQLGIAEFFYTFFLASPENHILISVLGCYGCLTLTSAAAYLHPRRLVQAVREKAEFHLFQEAEAYTEDVSATFKSMSHVGTAEKWT